MTDTTAKSPAPRIGFVSLGCPKALVDSERIITRLRAEGYELSASYQDADAVVRNPQAPADARIGAALALAAAGERVRVADAAAPVAEPRLRIALEAVAEGREDPAILEAATSAKQALGRP